jgi:hypothetical protein
MARVTVYEGGKIERQGTTGARLRPVESGPSALGGGLQSLGRTGNEWAERADRVEEVFDKVNASELEVEHLKLDNELTKKVRASRGTAAEGAYLEAQTQLQTTSEEILKRARSPRAQMMLRNSIERRNLQALDRFDTHRLEQVNVAFEGATKAQITSHLENAADLDDEGDVEAELADADAVIEKRAAHFGRTPEEVEVEKASLRGETYFSRAKRKVTLGSQAVIDYANEKRAFLSSDQYDALVGAHHKSAVEEWAEQAADAEALTPTTTTVIPGSPGTPGTVGAGTGNLDPRSFFETQILKYEGGYTIDVDGAPVNMGINGKANPGVDIKNLTKAQAYDIYKKKYWDKSGAANLPPALAAVHMDTYYIGPAGAKRILKESGGDVNKYFQLRREWMAEMVRRDPAKFGKVEKGWKNRTNDLEQYASRIGGGGVAGTPGTADRIVINEGTSMEEVRTRVRGRKDLTTEAQNALINAIGRRVEQQRGDRANQWQEADIRADEAALAIGHDKITKPESQIPNWTELSPNSRARYTALAEQNNRPRPIVVSPELEAQIAFVRESDPARYNSPAYRNSLVGKLPPERLQQMGQESGAFHGRLAAQKPTFLDDGTIWGVAKDVIKGMDRLPGEDLDWDSVQSKAPTAKRLEAISDARHKTTFLNYMREVSGHWAQANPGQRPPDELLKKWAGAALRTANGSRAFQATNDQIVAGLTPGLRSQIDRELRQAGNGSPSNADRAAFYRRLVGLRGGQ